MKAVIQRVTRAAVKVNGQVVGQIGTGLLVLLGVAKGDGERDLLYIIEKIQTLRIFGDNEGKMNRALSEVGGALLLVSQFTLLGDTTKGRRPGFDLAAPPAEARALYEEAVNRLRAAGVACGDRCIRSAYAGGTAERWAGHFPAWIVGVAS